MVDNRIARAALPVLLFPLLLLAACGGGGPPPEYFTGREGIVISFEQETPPPEVYEESAVPLFVRLWNKGANDVAYDAILFSVKGDPFYVNVAQDEFERGTGVYHDPDGILNGKQPGYPVGEWIEYRPVAEFKKITGIREQPSTQLFASLCYPYTTTLGATLCVDANAFNGNVQRQVCSAETITLSDQGAPVAVTMIENRPAPVRVDSAGSRGFTEVVQPTFILHIRNVGRGTVLMPWPTDEETRLAACGLNVPEEELNALSINATLSGLPLVCEPDPVRLFNGEGYTTCTLPLDTESAINAPNYLGAFKAKLSYLYRQSEAVDVKIIRRPEGIASSQEFTYDERDEHPGFVEGMTRCEFCSKNPGDGRCDGFPQDEELQGLWTCSCGQSACRSLARKDDSCLFGHTWCPGTNYCCLR